MADTYAIQVYGGANTDTTSGGLGAVVASLSALQALQATMVTVGAGDNSANVTTLGTDLTTLATNVAAIGGANFPIVLLVDISRFTSGSAMAQIVAGMAASIAAVLASEGHP